MHLTFEKQLPFYYTYTRSQMIWQVGFVFLKTQKIIWRKQVIKFRLGDFLEKEVQSRGKSKNQNLRHCR